MRDQVAQIQQGTAFYWGFLAPIKVSKEPDSDKVAELSQELIKALDKETKEKLEHVTKTKRRRSA